MLLSQRNRDRFIWNRTVNNCGKKGKNIALDLHVEHSNNYVKQGVKNLDPNLNERSTNRICNAESGMRQIMENVDQNIRTSKGSGKHTHSSTENDLDELVNRLVQTVYSQNGPISASQNGHTNIGIRLNQKSFRCNF